MFKKNSIFRSLKKSKKKFISTCFTYNLNLFVMKKTNLILILSMIFFFSC